MDFLTGFLISLLTSFYGQDVTPVTYASSSALLCDLIVDAGPDTNLCAPGGTIQLQGSYTGSGVFTEWSPANQVSNPYILDPVATVNSPTTFTLTVYGIDPDNPNIIENGDFEMGNVGFNSGYTYVMDINGVQNEMNPEGTYTVIHNPNLVHSGFVACNDHTPAPGDQMMVLNGSANLQDIWCQTVSVSQGTYYDVSAWVASVLGTSPAILRFSINGVPLGSIVNAPSTPCIWVPFNAFWFSGNNTTAEICILNLNTAAGGNDFAIDDISMVELCIQTDEVEITLVTEDAPVPDITGPSDVCEGDIATYSATYINDPEVHTLLWTVPMGGQIISGQGTNSIQVSWNEAGFQDVCLTLFTRCDEDDACFSVVVENLPDPRNLNGPGSICEGETGIFYVPDLAPDETYNWIFPPQIIPVSGQGTNEFEFEYGSSGEFEVCVEIANPCGSITLCQSVLLASSYYVLLDTAVCEGTIIIINGNEYGNGILTGVELFHSIHGCDSIVEIEVTETDALMVFNPVSLCEGDSVFAQGMFQHTSGIYIDSYVTPSGCDSIVSTVVTVETPDTTRIHLTTCDPLSVDTTIQVFSNAVCDSVVITEIVYAAADTTWMLFTSCFPADTGTVITQHTNQLGCDSLAITQTTLLPSDTTLLYFTTCDIDQVGVVDVLFTNLEGCDSLVRSVTLFSLSDTTRIFQITCDPTLPDTTETLYQNILGCDSLVIHEIIWGGSDTTFTTSMTCDPAEAGIFFLTRINYFGCDSIISETVILIPSDTTHLLATTCEANEVGEKIEILTNQAGCDSLVITQTSLLPAAYCVLETNINTLPAPCYGQSTTITVEITEGLPPFDISIRSENILIDSVQENALGQFSFNTTGIEQVTVQINSANGLMDTYSLNGLTPPPLSISVSSDNWINGYDLACFGNQDGSATVQIIDPGTPDYTYSWSNDAITPTASPLGAGEYSVTVTDQNGCSSDARITLTQPSQMVQDILAVNPSCFGFTNGMISVSSQGGIEPWDIQINQHTGPGVSNLTEGVYSIVSTDQSGCIVRDTVELIAPEYWTISLPPDTTLSFGQSIQLTPQIVGQPMGMLIYEWSMGNCPNCPINTISPTGHSILSLNITDENGCVESDNMVISVDINRDVYIPDVFTPNGDSQNDIWFISGPPFLSSIPSVKIFDRWGNQVFQLIDVVPNSITHGWDGTFKGQKLQPGVFVYRVELLFQDGVERVRHGSITLMR